MCASPKAQSRSTSVLDGTRSRIGTGSTESMYLRVPPESMCFHGPDDDAGVPEFCRVNVETFLLPFGRL